MKVATGRRPINPDFLRFDPQGLVVLLQDRLDDIRSDIEALEGGHYAMEDFVEQLYGIHAICVTGLKEKHLAPYRKLIDEPLPKDRRTRHKP